MGLNHNAQRFVWPHSDSHAKLPLPLFCSHCKLLTSDALWLHCGDKHPLLSRKKEVELSYTLWKSLSGSFWKAEMERAK